MKTTTIYSLTLGLVLLVSHLGRAQEMPKMPEPTKEHAWLEKFVGDWVTESKGTMGPDQPPMECSGTLVSKKLGGFWVLNELKGDMAGTPMTGLQTLGYDEEKKKYVGTWVDSMSGFMWKYEGSIDKSGKILTLDADGPDFFNPGKTAKFQDIYEFKSENEILMSSRMKDEKGEWITFMTGTAKRKK